MITLKKETIFTASERVETRKIKVINTHHTYTHLAMHVLFIVGEWVGRERERERKRLQQPELQSWLLSSSFLEEQ
jgi:hypothetical protein